MTSLSIEITKFWKIISTFPVFYLYSGALIWEGRVEEGCDDAHHGDCDVFLQYSVRVLPIMCSITYLHNQQPANLLMIVMYDSSQEYMF